MGKESSRSRSRTNDLERRKKKSFPFQPANEGGLTEQTIIQNEVFVLFLFQVDFGSNFKRLFSDKKMVMDLILKRKKYKPTKTDNLCWIQSETLN